MIRAEQELKDFRENILDFLDNSNLYSDDIKKSVGTKLHLIPAFAA